MNRRTGRLYSLVVVLGMVALTAYSAPAAAGATSQRALSLPSTTSTSLPPTSRSDAPLVVSAPPRADTQLGPGPEGGRRRAGLTIDPSAAGPGGAALAPIAPAASGSSLSLSPVIRRAAGRPRAIAPQDITVSSGSSATSCSRLSAVGTGTPNHYAAVRVYDGSVSSGTPLIDSFTDKTSQGAGAYYALIGSDGTFHVEASFAAQPAGTTIQYVIYDAPSNTYGSFAGGAIFNTTVASCTPQAPINVSSATTYCSRFAAQGTGTSGQYAAVRVWTGSIGSGTPLIDSYTDETSQGAGTYYALIGSDGAFNVSAPFAAQPPGTTLQYRIYGAPLNTYNSYDEGSYFDTTVACTQDPATPAAQTAAAQTAAAQTSVAQTSVAQTAAAQTAAAQQTATAVAQTAAAQTAAVQTAVQQQTATAAAQTSAAQTATVAAQTSVAQTAAAQTAAVQTAAAQTAAAQTSAAQTAATRTAAAAPTSVPATSVPPTSVPPTSPANTSTLPTSTTTPVQSGSTKIAATATTSSSSSSSPTPAATAIVAPPSTRCLRLSSGQVATGGTLTVQVCTAPRAALTLTLQVLGPPAPARGKDHGHARPPAVLYSVAVAGQANARGRFTARLHITYHVKGAVPARLTLRTAGHVLTTTVRLTPAQLSPTRCLRPSSGQVATGGTLTVQVCTAPRAAVTLTLQVLGAPARSGKGHGHVRPPAVLYSVAVTGHASAHGRFTGRLHITYRLSRAAPARLTLRTAGHVLTTTVRLTPA